MLRCACGSRRRVGRSGTRRRQPVRCTAVTSTSTSRFVASTDQLASARIAVATMASASGRGQSSVPDGHPVHRWPEDEIQRHLGVDVRIQFTASDTALVYVRLLHCSVVGRFVTVTRNQQT
jgi:hypothetical protein